MRYAHVCGVNFRRRETVDVSLYRDLLLSVNQMIQLVIKTLLNGLVRGEIYLQVTKI